MFENLPRSVLEIMRRLEACGFEAYIVGGCVRDIIMGVPPHDYDICTQATPPTVKACLDDMRILDTGIKHGTVSVIIEGDALSPYEITTFRTEGAYSDGRHPDAVSFVSDVNSDLARRDFTINAMAYSPVHGLADAYGGRGDIKNKLIKCVGAPEKRFDEDALRILRAVRFAAVTGFEIDGGTRAAMQKCLPNLSAVSAERISAELIKAVNGAFANKAIGENITVIRHIMPETAALSAFEAACKAGDIYVRLAALLYGAGEAAARARLKALKMNGALINGTAQLVKYAQTPLKCEKPFIRRLIGTLGKAQTVRLVQLKGAIGNMPIGFEAAVKDVLNTESCFTVKQLDVNGDDLAALGVPRTEQMHRILNALLSMVLDEKLPNERGALLNEAQKMFKNGLQYKEMHGFGLTDEIN